MILLTKEASATAFYTEFQVIICCECLLPFAVMSEVRERLRNNGNTFYCPNGHAMSYNETEAIRLRKQLNAKEELVKKIDRQLADTTEKLRIETRKAKIQAAKLKRVQAGVCPCCNRTFEDLARHMKDMHPQSLKDFEKPNQMHTKINAKKK